MLLHEDRLAGRAGREVEAESVAYLVCTSLGIHADAYSFPYLAGWSGRDPSLVQATAERAISSARAILTTAAADNNAGEQPP